MNRFLKILTLTLSFILVIVAFVFCLNQRRIVSNLKAQQAQLSEELQHKSQVQKILEGFKKKGLKDLERQESFVMARIPQDEKDPLSVLKLLTQVAKEAEISKISITSKPKERAQVASVGNLYLFPLKLELECGYQELCAFLNKILSMDRLVVIQELLIERKEEVLPKLRVDLTLFAYTILSPETYQPEEFRPQPVQPKPKVEPESDLL